MPTDVRQAVVFYTRRKTSSILFLKKVRQTSCGKSFDIINNAVHSRIHLQYGAGECSHDYYKESVSRVTSVFQALSQEMLEIMKVFRDKNESEVVSILEQVQSSEKEKLELVVGLHLLTHTVSSSEDSEDKLYQLKKRLGNNK